MGHTSQSERIVAETSGFEREVGATENWLARRSQARIWTTVELGHGASPLAMQEVFDGDRVYIGVEAWHQPRDREVYRTLLDAAKENSPNAFFVRHEDGFDLEHYLAWLARPDLLDSKNLDYQTVLPEGIAHEVVLKDVLGDPRVFTGGVSGLLAETRRLVSLQGRVVICESLTPWPLDKKSIYHTGLEIVEVQIPGSERYDRLIQTYAPFKRCDHEREYVVLLAPR